MKQKKKIIFLLSLSLRFRRKTRGTPYEIHTDRRNVALRVRVVLNARSRHAHVDRSAKEKNRNGKKKNVFLSYSEAQQQARLADTRVADQQQFEQIVVFRVHPWRASLFPFSLSLALSAPVSAWSVVTRHTHTRHSYFEVDLFVSLSRNTLHSKRLFGLLAFREQPKKFVHRARLFMAPSFP